MCEPVVTGAMLAAVAAGTVLQLAGNKKDADAAVNQLTDEARLSELQARDALKRGGIEQERVRLAGRELEGAQRVSFAAGNVDTQSGSAAAIIEQTGAMTELDAAVARANAEREAWMHQTNARNRRIEAANVRRGGPLRTASTLLGGFSQGLSVYASRPKGK